MPKQNQYKTKHTQGEWSLEYDFSIVMQNQIVCSRIAPDNASREEVIANAKLIASAPEILEALKKMVLWANIKDGSPSQSLRDEAIKAIRKATE